MAFALNSFSPIRAPMAARPSRAARMVVRAEQNPVEEVSQKLDQEVGPAAREAVETTTQRTVAETSPAQQDTSFGKVMAFSGYAPERVNSRLAMLGVTAALGAEFATGKGLVEQINTAPVAIGLTFLVFTVASVVPILKNLSPEKAETGPFTSKSELYNGRLAMLGFLVLVLQEVAKGGVL